MKKQQIVLGIIVIAIILLVVLYSGVKVPSFYIGSFTPLAISSVNIYNTDNELLAKTLALVFTVNSGTSPTGYFSGTFQPNVINNYLGSNGQVTNSFTFDAGFDSEKCYYPIAFSSAPNSKVWETAVYKAYYLDLTCKAPWEATDYANGKIDCLNAGVQAQSACNTIATNHGGYPMAYAGCGSLDISCTGGGYCAYVAKDAGAFGDFYQPNYLFTIKSNLTINGQTATGGTSISNLIGTDSQPTNIPLMYNGTEIAHLNWNGNLSTGKSCDTVSAAQSKLVNVTTANSPSGWRVITNTSYINYDNAINNLNVASQYPASQKSTVVNLVNTLNQKVEQVYTDGSNHLSNGLPTVGTHPLSYSSTSNKGTSAGSLYYDASGISIPLMTLFIKADSLGFVQPTPKVCNLTLNAPTKEMYSGGQIPININWTNCGQTGSFEVKMACTGSLYNNSGTIGSGSINANSAASSLLYAQGTCQTTNTNNTCTVTVTPSTMFSGGTPVTATVSGLSCKQLPQCSTAGTKVCVDNVSYKSCGTDLQWSNITQCPTNQVCDQASGNCVAKTNNCLPLIQEYCGGQCVSVCGTGLIRNATTCQCEGGSVGCSNGEVKYQDQCMSAIKAQCLAKQPDLLVTSWNYDAGIPLIKSESCNPTYNWPLVLVAIAIIFIIAFFGYTMLTGKKGKRRK